MQSRLPAQVFGAILTVVVLASFFQDKSKKKENQTAVVRVTTSAAKTPASTETSTATETPSAKVIKTGEKNIYKRIPLVGAPPLSLAIHRGASPDAIRALIKNGANLNKPTMDGQTPLMIATILEDKETIKILIENGALVDKVLAGSGLTALGIAFFEGSLDVAEFLLSSGADPNLVNSVTGTTPLQDAVVMNNADAVALLVKSGANPLYPYRDEKSENAVSTARARAAQVPGDALNFMKFPDAEKIIRIWQILKPYETQGAAR